MIGPGEKLARSRKTCMVTLSRMSFEAPPAGFGAAEGSALAACAGLAGAGVGTAIALSSSAFGINYLHLSLVPMRNNKEQYLKLSKCL